MHYHDANTSLKGLTELKLYNGIKCTIMLTLQSRGNTVFIVQFTLNNITELVLLNV